MKKTPTIEDKMMKDNSLILSTFVKTVHEDLRKQCNLFGEDTAWRSHCEDKIKLKEYANAMKELSSAWEKNFISRKKAVSRIIWTYKACVFYFNEGIEACQQKEQIIMNRLNIKFNGSCAVSNETSNYKWKLLDVGSCYNPFKEFDCFQVTAIDIVPATDDVYKCDFLNVPVGDSNIMENNMFTCLQHKCFDIVVFSLLLEYLPSPNQRLACCKKAYEVLKTEGLLVIISPDSNHVGSNTNIIKSWRFILAEIGLSRIKYEKLPHLHCMVFRKSFTKAVPMQWAALYKRQQIYEKMHIPQDFSSVSDLPQICENIGNPLEVKKLFEELPKEV